MIDLIPINNRDVCLMALILIVITNQIRHIRINERRVYKRIDERYNKGLVIKGK